MFKTLEILDSQRHADLTFTPSGDYSFARSVTSAPVAMSEMRLAAREFPVVFSGEGKPRPIALFSVKKGENPFVGADGSWTGRYVPAHIKRYPFILGDRDESGEAQKFWVMIDQAAPHFQGDTGEALFVDGQEPENGVVARAKSFLTQFQRELMQTEAALQPLADAGLLVSRQFTVTRGDRQEIAVSGFRMVDSEKLKALDDATLAGWARSGLLSLVHAHQHSLDNANDLLREQENAA